MWVSATSCLSLSSPPTPLLPIPHMHMHIPYKSLCKLFSSFAVTLLSLSSGFLAIYLTISKYLSSQKKNLYSWLLVSLSYIQPFFLLFIVTRNFQNSMTCSLPIYYLNYWNSSFAPSRCWRSFHYSTKDLLLAQTHGHLHHFSFWLCCNKGQDETVSPTCNT